MPDAPALPSRARAVVVGGGVIGCSVAYHLAEAGFGEVLLLERDRLTSGTTWHAAGLMVTFGSTSQTSTRDPAVHAGPLRPARGRDRAVDRAAAGRVRRAGHGRRPPRGVPADVGVQPLLRRRRPGDRTVGGRLAVPTGAGGRRPRRVLRRRRRPRRPGRRDHGARQGRAAARRHDPRGRPRHRRPHPRRRRRAPPRHRRPDAGGRRRGGGRRQLHRHVGPAARRGRRRRLPLQAAEHYYLIVDGGGRRSRPTCP